MFTERVFERGVENGSKLPIADTAHGHVSEMIGESVRKVEAGLGLSREEAEAAMEELLQGRLEQRAIVRLLTALRDKGETVDELVGFARAMRRHAVPIFPGKMAANRLGRESGQLHNPSP